MFKYFVPHCFIPPPFWSWIFSDLEACAFKKVYMHLFDIMFFASVCTSMKSKHLLDMIVSKFVRHWRSHKKMSISILLSPLKRKMYSNPSEVVLVFNSSNNLSTLQKTKGYKHVANICQARINFNFHLSNDKSKEQFKNLPQMLQCFIF
jgi:hypothetical protein